jgi:hypothetical protein
MFRRKPPGSPRPAAHNINRIAKDQESGRQHAARSVAFVAMYSRCGCYQPNRRPSIAAITARFASVGSV